MKNFLFKSYILFLFVFLTIVFISPPDLNADSYKVWVDTSHWDTGYEYVEEWVPCNITFVCELYDRWILPDWAWMVEEVSDAIPKKGVINSRTYKYYKVYVCNKYFYGFTGFGSDPIYYLTEDFELVATNDFGQEEWKLPYKIKYKCYEVLTKKRVAYKKWVKEGHWEYYEDDVLVDESDTYRKGELPEGEEVEFEDREGYQVEAEGMVMHTDRWNENRIKYNLSKTGDPEKPRGYDIFFNGEKFILKCRTTGDFIPKKVHVDFVGTGFSDNLEYVGDGLWEGYIWDESFINFHDRDCVFKFTSEYEFEGESFEIEDEVTVYVVRESYWQLHRGF